MGAILGTCLIILTGIFVLTALHIDDKRKERLASASSGE